MFQQLGTITRLLHDTMQQLGVMPKLQTATEGLPDARSRLSYIATKTAEAANKVLNTVDAAKIEHRQISRGHPRDGRDDRRRPGQGRGLGRRDELRATKSRPRPSASTTT